MDKYSIIACLGLVFIVSYLFLRRKRQESILWATGISTIVSLVSAVAATAVYLLIRGLILAFTEAFEENMIASTVMLVVCIAFAIDVVIYIISRFRQWKHEQTERKLSRLLGRENKQICEEDYYEGR